jgi:hypothetical protein
MTHSNRRFRRRTWLTGLGASATLLPFLPITQSEAGGGGAPIRLIFFFTPNGLYRDSYTPSGEGNNFTLGPTLEPLQPYKDDMLVLAGLDNEGWLQDPKKPPDHGFRLNVMTGTHSKHLFVNDSGKNVNAIGGISIDQFIAQGIAADVPFQSLNLGVLSNPISGTRKLWARGPEDPVATVDDPAQVHEMLFANLDVDPAEIARLRARRQSVIDVVRSDLGGLQTRVGAADAAKMEAHLEAIRAIEKRIDGTGCAPIELADANGYRETGTLMMDMLAASLACDVTRVAVLNWSGPSSAQTFPWLDVNAEWHPLAHHSSTARQQAGWSDQQQLYDGITRVDRWHAEQMAYLLDKLAEYSEGDGTVRDRTIVVWCTDQGQDGGSHDRRNLPVTMVGSGGGYFDTGRFLDVGSRPLNDFYVSLCHAMGLTNVDKFGHPDISDGPLAGLT